MRVRQALERRHGLRLGKYDSRGYNLIAVLSTKDEKGADKLLKEWGSSAKFKDLKTGPGDVVSVQVGRGIPFGRAALITRGSSTAEQVADKMVRYAKGEELGDQNPMSNIEKLREESARQLDELNAKIAQLEAQAVGAEGGEMNQGEFDDEDDLNLPG